MSQQLAHHLGLELHRSNAADVRLADGSTVSSTRYTDTLVLFGATQRMVRFQVLPCAVSTILGVPFFKDMNLQINWEKKEVFCQQKSRKIIFQLAEDQKTDPAVEVCSLPTFTNGIKKNHYSSAALVVVTPTASCNAMKINATEDLTDKYVCLDDHGRFK